MIVMNCNLYRLIKWLIRFMFLFPLQKESYLEIHFLIRTEVCFVLILTIAFMEMLFSFRLFVNDKFRLS